MATSKYEVRSVKCPDKFTYNAKLNDCVAKGAGLPDLSSYATIADVTATYEKVKTCTSTAAGSAIACPV